MTPEDRRQLEEGVDRVLQELKAYALEEGKSLENDLRDQERTIRDHLEEIGKREGERVNTKRDRLKKALEETMEDGEYDKERFEQELVYFLDKLDLNEEKVRLENHCRYFLETLEEGPPNGKKLEFIAQEMGREINTIGAKANDADIQHAVVRMKDALGKIREQVMNVM